MGVLGLRGTRRIAMLIAGFLGAGLVAITSPVAVAETSQLSVAEYAKTVCAPMREVKRVDDYIFEIAKRRGPGNFAASQLQGIELTTDYRNVWANAAATFKTTSPRVRDGEKIGKLFADYATRAVDEIEKAVDAFKAVDPASDGWRDAVISLAVAVSEIRPLLGDPLKMVTDRSVRIAFTREKTCAEVFPSVIDPEGRFTQFLSGHHPFGMTERLDPHGNLWFTQGTPNPIGKVDPAARAVTTAPGPAGAAVGIGITMGPDGNVWFVARPANAPAGPPPAAAQGQAAGGRAGRGQAASGQIGKINPATGVATVVPTPNASPNGIAAGSDGNVWFVDAGRNQVGKIAPATGAVTVFPIPTAGARPFAITAGPDGNLWFTENGAGQIGRIDPRTGVVTEFPVPTTGSMYAITAGPDGNVWFTQQIANRIWRIDPAGRLTMFPIPTTAAGLMGITAGCDGDLWFAENNANKIGKIDPKTGVVTEFLVPLASSEPAYMAALSDGTLWFTDEVLDGIWKFDPGAASKKQKDGKTLSACLTLPKA